LKNRHEACHSVLRLTRIYYVTLRYDYSQCYNSLTAVSILFGNNVTQEIYVQFLSCNLYLLKNTHETTLVSENIFCLKIT